MHKLRILARAELALARIRVQRTGFQAALFAVAALFALAGLALLNLAAYNALVPRLGPAIAALAVGGVNLLLAAIAAARDRPVARLLTAVGIPLVGSTVARTLARRFRSLERIMSASEEELDDVDGIGPEIVRSVRLRAALR